MAEGLLLRKNLRREVIKLFAEEYLAAPEHRAWCQTLKDAPTGIPADRFHVFGGHLLKATAANLAQAFNEQPHANVVVADGLFRPAVIPGKDAVHRDLRTVFATPIPFYAEEGDIVDFFKKYGDIESIDRREWTDMKSGEKVTRKKPGIFIIFKAKEGAEKCVAEKPSYKALDSVGKYFIPELQVKMREDNHAKLPTARQDQNFQKPSPASCAPTLSPAAVEFLHSQFILVVDGLPETTQWRDLRAFTQRGILGAEKSGVRSERKVVYTLLAAARGVAYLFFKSADLPASIAATKPRMDFRSSTVALRVANDADMEYLATLPVEGAEASRKRPAENAGDENPSKRRAL